jgi:N-acetylglucosamine-6-phosphate deacetylase
MQESRPRGTRHLITNARVLGAQSVPAGDLGWVQVHDGLIEEVGRGRSRVVRDAEILDAAGGYLTPGFIDQHCHGGGGVDVTQGAEHARVVAATHLSHGTTTLMASLVTADVQDLVAQIDALVPLVDDQTFVGIHLEGPWLSPAHCGAHPPALLTPPATADVHELLEAGAGRIAMVTLAPELDGGLDAVHDLVAAGVVVAIGHTRADAVTTRAALDAGAGVATHLFNGMPPLSHRDPGVAGALLRDPRVTVELIADGIHVHPDALAIAIRAAGPDRVALVTDAMAAAGAPDGAYQLGEMQVLVRAGEARLAAGGSLAGSTLTLDRALRTLVTRADVPLAAAVTMLTATPARVLGLTDRGRIAPGLRADLVMLDGDLRVARVMRGGRWVTPVAAEAG